MVPDPDPLVRGTDSGIRIRIRTKMSRIPNTDGAFVKVSRADLDRRTIAGEIEAGSKNMVLHSWPLTDLSVIGTSGFSDDMTVKWPTVETTGFIPLAKYNFYRYYAIVIFKLYIMYNFI